MRRNKYNAKKTLIDGIRFDSKAEGEYYKLLRFMERRNEVEILELQPKVYLTCARILYKPDFLILEDGKKVWIDVKGVPTPVFNLKKRLWQHYGPGLLQVITNGVVDEYRGPEKAK